MTRKRWDRDVLNSIEELAMRGLGASEIQEELARRPEIRDRLPGLRTIQRMVGQWASDDDAWTLPPVTEPDSRFMLDVLRDVITTTQGRVRTISAADADWIRSVHSAAPDLDPWRTYLAARAYAALRRKGEATTELNVVLAFAPWRSDDNVTAYLQAVVFGATGTRRWEDGGLEAGWLDEVGVLRAAEAEVSGRGPAGAFMPGVGIQPEPDLSYVTGELMRRARAD